MQRPQALEEGEVGADQWPKRSRVVWLAIAACALISAALLIALFSGLLP